MDGLPVRRVWGWWESYDSEEAHTKGILGIQGLCLINQQLSTLRGWTQPLWLGLSLVQDGTEVAGCAETIDRLLSLAELVQEWEWNWVWKQGTL